MSSIVLVDVVDKNVTNNSSPLANNQTPSINVERPP
jgi:hypothetical protein